MSSAPSNVTGAEQQLESMLLHVMEQNDQLVKENDIFTAHIFRLHQAHVAQESGDDGQKSVIDIKLSPEGLLEKLSEPSGESYASDDDSNNLTIEQKLQLMQVEKEAINSDIDDIAARYQKDVASLKEVLEETQTRASEIKKSAYEFRRDVVIGAENVRTGKIKAERIVRYFEDKISQKNALAEKLRTKNLNLKNQIQKNDLQLKQKAEQGDSLHQIDFHQLQIENRQYNQKIEERNKELLKLKMATGKTVQVLNNAKVELSNRVDQASSSRSALEERRIQLMKLQSELDRTMEDVQRSKRLMQKYQHRLDSMEMPQILDYVKQKADFYELEQEITNWQRKIEIAEVAASKMRRYVKAARRDRVLKDDAEARQKAEGEEALAHASVVQS